MGRRFAGLSACAFVCALTLAYSGAALAEDGPGCEFPAQSVELERPVNITNSAPSTSEVETDVCGNIVDYTEQMTSTPTVGSWAIAANGSPRLASTPAAPGWSGPQLIPTGPLVG